jgi:hypothetical protein
MLASPVLNVGQATVTAFSFFVEAVGGGDGYNCQSYAPCLFRFCFSHCLKTCCDSVMLLCAGGPLRGVVLSAQDTIAVPAEHNW